MPYHSTGELHSPFQVDFDIALTFRKGVRTGKDINSGAMFINMNNPDLALGLTKMANEFCQKMPSYSMNDQYSWIAMLNLFEYDNNIDK